MALFDGLLESATFRGGHLSSDVRSMWFAIILELQEDIILT
jgi:hypothetical protein